MLLSSLGYYDAVVWLVPRACFDFRALPFGYDLGEQRREKGSFY